jgi:hypothetical protein
MWLGRRQMEDDAEEKYISKDLSAHIFSDIFYSRLIWKKYRDFFKKNDR